MFSYMAMVVHIVTIRLYAVMVVHIATIQLVANRVANRFGCLAINRLESYAFPRGM